MEVPYTALISLNIKSEDEVSGSPQSLDWVKKLCRWCRKAPANMEKEEVQYKEYQDICRRGESKSRCLGCAILSEVGKIYCPELANRGRLTFALQFWGNEVKRQRFVVELCDVMQGKIGLKVLLSGKPGWCLHGHLLHCLILFRPAQSVESGNLS
jgi:hypothetical protein